MSGITLEQMEALFDKKITPLKEAISSIREELTPLKEAITSMGSKLEDHDALLEKVNLRIKVLEGAPAQSGIDEKIKSAISIVENKMALKYEVKLDEFKDTSVINSNYLIEQLITYNADKTKGGGGSLNYENRVPFDTDMTGAKLTFFSAPTFRRPHESGYLTATVLAHIAEHPFTNTCDTRGQIDNLFKLLNFQDKGVYQTYNSFLEYY